VLGKMQSAYQSDEFDDDASSFDNPTSSDGAYSEAYNEDNDKNDSEESGRQRIIDARVAKQIKSESGESWLNQLGPRTRRRGRVNYNEEKIIPATTPPKVCLDSLNEFEEPDEPLAKFRRFTEHDVSWYVLALTCRKDNPAQ
jgi:hypothetical protein